MPSLDRPDRAEWRGAADFAEVAEALGVPTDRVLLIQAARPATDAADVVAVYSADPDDTTLSIVDLRRDRDGILRLASVPLRRPGLWERIRDGLDRLDPDRPDRYNRD
jgi:hypothetical protein